ncbi:MAG: hypothetical protein EWV92_09270 [Microcystis aeruginosa Ma_MB_S_20031200_S102]|uniref:Uncharacterized protein n=1 Tax=Microcystis aeruginosa Ma_MB_S_20031200_S102 TaxID=2486254 RepID=A0A552EU63_MICAE|nr:MAG: hypothetical protein EWV79_02405 [Microcystis aeruginosa Ma_MB_S_20031200_S102D]TRU37995.1 MAG: hypothetical protein EWV92_09270 [Microcystis aeruginosa Ma_MB_S_20031200_S102]
MLSPAIVPSTSTTIKRISTVFSHLTVTVNSLPQELSRVCGKKFFGGVGCRVWGVGRINKNSLGVLTRKLILHDYLVS